MNDLDITRLRVYLVAPKVTPHYRWTGSSKPSPIYYNIVRLTTACGIEGASGVLTGDFYEEQDQYDDAEDFAEAFRPVIAGLIGKNLQQREAITRSLLKARAAPIPEPESLIEIALWDAIARKADQPLYKLLGGARERIPAYASSPVFETVDEYLDYVRLIQRKGYLAVKFHTQCDPDFDLEMVSAVSNAIADSDLHFMVDIEQTYDYERSIVLGRALSRMPCDWLEAPLADTDIDAYVELRRAVDVDILCAGNTVVDLPDITDAIEQGAWSRLRCDPCNMGGISAAIKAMDFADSHGLKTELQSYGYPLSQAANLHVMLAVNGCSYFEHPVPFEHFEYACANPIRIERDGCVSAPGGPGLGLELAWDEIERDASMVIDTDTL
ncbi:MAG: mandelate racemase/muconate lactonizing enzyme family protein [Pseudomonadales bacterium]